MDIQTLSQQLTAFLAPFLPYLLKMGEQAAEEAGAKLGAEAWEGAKAPWGKVQPKVEAKPAAQEVAQEVAAHPAKEDAQEALRLHPKDPLTHYHYAVDCLAPQRLLDQACQHLRRAQELRPAKRATGVTSSRRRRKRSSPRLPAPHGWYRLP